MFFRAFNRAGACATETHAPYISADRYSQRTLNRNEANMEPGMNRPGFRRETMAGANHESVNPWLLMTSL